MDNYSEPRVTGQPEAAGRERPGCITLYAILLILGGIASLAAAFLAGYGFVVEPDMVTTGIVLLVCMAAWSLIPIVMAVGLWRMRMWAWWLVVIFQIVALGVTCTGVVLLIPVLVTTVDAGIGSAELIGFLAGVPIGVIINGVILYWFLMNRDRFRKPLTVHVGGRALEEPGSDNVVVIVAVTVIGVVAILCVVSVAVIALLTLLGPQIGTTFSEITRGLMTPAP